MDTPDPATPTARVLANASYGGGLMFLTALDVALVLASAGGQLIARGSGQLGYTPGRLQPAKAARSPLPGPG